MSQRDPLTAEIPQCFTAAVGHGDRGSHSSGPSTERDVGRAFAREFPTDDACLNYLWRVRFAPDGDHAWCPRCRAVRLFRRYDLAAPRRSWTCTRCGHHLYPTAGTIFARSPTGLRRWFYAAHMMMTTGGRVSARQLQRELGVTYKTAWRIRDKLRLAMSGGEPVWRELAATLAGHRTGPQQGPSPTDTDVLVAVADHGGDTHHNLPTYLTRFVGREREIRAAIQWLRKSRLVTLVGPGGCGKTRPTLRVAMTEFERHRDGVWWVDLARLAPGQAITGAPCPLWSVCRSAPTRIRPPDSSGASRARPP